MAMRIQQYRGDAAAFQDVRATDAFAPAQAVARQVQAAMAGGKAFDEAVRTISAAPVLPPPGVAADRKSLLDSLNGLPPSTVSAVFALITDVANRQRQANAEQRFLTSEKQVDEMLGQARDIRSKAVSELVFGMVNGAVSVASGAASAAVSLKGMGEANQMSERASARLAEAEALPGGRARSPPPFRPRVRLPAGFRLPPRKVSPMPSRWPPMPRATSRDRKLPLRLRLPPDLPLRCSPPTTLLWPPRTP